MTGQAGMREKAGVNGLGMKEFYRNCDILRHRLLMQAVLVPCDANLFAAGMAIRSRVY